MRRVIICICVLVLCAAFASQVTNPANIVGNIPANHYVIGAGGQNVQDGGPVGSGQTSVSEASPTPSGPVAFNSTVTFASLSPSSPLCTDASKSASTTSCFPIPSIVSGFGTSPSIAGTKLSFFTITVGTSPGNTGVIGFSPAAPVGFFCVVTDVTTLSTSVFVTRQIGAGTTSQVTVGNFSNVAVAGPWTAGDILNVSCTFG